MFVIFPYMFLTKTLKKIARAMRVHKKIMQCLFDAKKNILENKKLQPPP